MKHKKSEQDKEKELLNTPESKKDTTDILLDKATDSFKWWNNLATINKEDSLVMLLFKLSIRVVGIIVMIIISPFALVGLIVAFMAVI